MVSQEVAAYLATKGYGSTAAPNPTIVWNVKPDSPDAVVSVIVYGSLPDEPDQLTLTTRLEYPRIQIWVRGVKDDSDNPELVSQQIKATLMAFVGNTSLSGVLYKAFMPVSGPMKLKQDDNFRWEWVTNYQVVKAVSVT